MLVIQLIGLITIGLVLVACLIVMVPAERVPIRLSPAVLWLRVYVLALDRRIANPLGSRPGDGLIWVAMLVAILTAISSWIIRLAG